MHTGVTLDIGLWLLDSGVRGWLLTYAEVTVTAVMAVMVTCVFGRLEV